MVLKGSSAGPIIRLNARVTPIAASNSANAEIGGLIVGTSVHQGTAANSLVLSNIDDDGDIQMLVNDGGNSKEFLFADGDTAILHLGQGMASILLSKTISIAAGVVTGATSITSTAFLGTIDGVVGGNTPAAITGTTIDAQTDFTIGSTIITDGVITDSSGLQLAANLDINGTADISGVLTMSGDDIDMNTNDLTNVGISGDGWTTGVMTMIANGQFDMVIEHNNGAALEIKDSASTMVKISTQPGGVTTRFWEFYAPANTVGTAGRNDVNQHIMRLNSYTTTMAGTTTVTGAWKGMMLELGVPTIAKTDSGGSQTITTASSFHIEAIQHNAGAGSNAIVITNNRMISTTESDCYLTHDGVWTDSSSTQKGKQDIIDLPLQDVGSLISQIRPRTYQYKDSRGDFGRTRYGAVAEEFPDFLRVPGDASHSAVNSTVLANFALVASVYLADKYEQLNERLEAIGA
jgi:hypothetical protein